MMQESHGPQMPAHEMMAAKDHTQRHQQMADASMREARRMMDQGAPHDGAARMGPQRMKKE